MASKASEAAKDLDNIISIIVFYFAVCNCKPAWYAKSSSIEAKIRSIRESGGDLKNLASPLSILRNKIMSIK